MKKQCLYILYLLQTTSCLQTSTIIEDIKTADEKTTAKSSNKQMHLKTQLKNTTKKIQQLHDKFRAKKYRYTKEQLLHLRDKLQEQENNLTKIKTTITRSFKAGPEESQLNQLHEQANQGLEEIENIQTQITDILNQLHEGVLLKKVAQNNNSDQTWQKKSFWSMPWSQKISYIKETSFNVKTNPFDNAMYNIMDHANRFTAQIKELKNESNSGLMQAQELLKEQEAKLETAFNLALTKLEHTKDHSKQIEEGLNTLQATFNQCIKVIDARYKIDYNFDENSNLLTQHGRSINETIRNMKTYIWETKGKYNIA